MKLKNLLIAIAVFFSWNTFAQQTQGPNSISQGTFVGTTIALRDMPSVTEMEEEGFEYAREIKQKFDPSQKNAVFTVMFRGKYNAEAGIEVFKRACQA